MRSIFLPRVPACGKRQSPKGTDQRHHKEQIKSFDLVCSFFARRRGRTEGSSICAAYSCRGFPLAGNGNPQRVPTGGTIKNKLNLLIWFVLFFARRRGRTEGSSICVAYSCRGFPLAGNGNPQRVPTSGTIKNKLNLLIWFVLFLSDVGGEPKVRQYAQHILTEGSRLRETAIPKGYRPAAIKIKEQPIPL